MKPIFLYLCLCTAFACAADNPVAPQKDKAGNWVFPTFTLNCAKGNWDNAKLWRDGKTPEGTLPRVNIVAGASVTLSKPVTTPMSVIYVGIYYPKQTEIFFENGASASVGIIGMPVAYVKDGKAAFYMRGGNLTVGDLKESEFNGSLMVGCNRTASGRAHFVISGGNLSASLGVGSDTPNTHEGVFTVEGSKAKITGVKQRRAGLSVQNSGTLEFVLDEKGVSTLDFTGLTATFAPGATVRADGTAYTGGSQTIALIQCKNIAADAPFKTEVRGFSSVYEAAVSSEKDRAILKITKRAR